jgi:hypothetical protein
VTEWGFAFLNNPNPAPPPPPPVPLPPAWEASSSGGGAALTAHPGPGHYQITFYRIGTPPGGGLGVVHVTAAPAENAPVWCQAGSWGPQNGNEVINVVCYQAPKAVPVNTDFSVTFGWNAPGSVSGPSFGYLESNGVSGTNTQFDSAGGTITSTLVARGRWTVIMPGLGGTGRFLGGIQVTTATVQPGHCKLINWQTTAAQQGIEVRCFTTTGAPANLPWTLTYQNGTDIVGRTPADFGYIWHAGAAPPGTNVNSCGPMAINTVTPPNPYTVTFPCIFAPSNDVQLTASGQNFDFCAISPLPWAANGPDVNVPDVSCFHVNGTPSPADNMFATYTAL